MTLQEEIDWQTPTVGGFICRHCRHHRGGVNCEKNVFISVEGANMKGCPLYEEERRSRTSTESP